jgi:hypothetical protein
MRAVLQTRVRQARAGEADSGSGVQASRRVLLSVSLEGIALSGDALFAGTVRPAGPSREIGRECRVLVMRAPWSCDRRARGLRRLRTEYPSTLVKQKPVSSSARRYACRDIAYRDIEEGSGG